MSKKNKKFIIIAFSIICSFNLVFAQILHPDVVALTNLEDSKEKLSQLEQENQNLTLKIQELNQNTEAELEKQNLYKEKISVVTEQISELNQEINTVSNDIEQKCSEIDNLKESIKLHIELLKQRLRTIYMTGQVSFIDIILSAKDFSDFFDKISITKAVYERDHEDINLLRSEMEQLDADTCELSNMMALLEDSKKDLDLKNQEYENLLSESGLIVSELSNQVQDYSNIVSKNNSEMEAINNEIEAYYAEQRALQEQQAELARQAEFARQAELQRQAEEAVLAQEQEKNVQSSETSQSVTSQENSSSTPEVAPTNPVVGSNYVWPVPGFYYISSPYGEGRDGYYHGGIDIAGAGIYGAPIVAAQSGTVSNSWYSNGGWGGGYGTYCLIDHGNGQTTLYAHMSRIVVSPGQSVSKGQVIGYVGSTGDSTGPHLHFETRNWGVRYNPMTEY